MLPRALHALAVVGVLGMDPLQVLGELGHLGLDADEVGLDLLIGGCARGAGCVRDVRAHLAGLRVDAAPVRHADAALIGLFVVACLWSILLELRVLHLENLLGESLESVLIDLIEVSLPLFGELIGQLCRSELLDISLVGGVRSVDFCELRVHVFFLLLLGWVRS